MANLPTSILRPLLCAMAVGCMITASGQCTNASAYGSAAAPTSTTPVTISTCSFQSEYSTITGIVAGTSYTVTSDCGGYITVRRVTYNGTFVANGNSPLTFTAPTAGTYYLHWNTNAACGTASNCCTTTIACTSCPPPPGQCTAVSIPSLPVTGQAVICHASDLLTSTNVGICGSGSTLYLGGNEALYSVTPTTTDNYVINYAGQSYSSIWVYSGACPAAGGMCQGSVSGTGTAQSLVVTMTAGVQYWIIFDTWPTPQSPCPGTFSITVSSVPPPVTASDCILAVPVCTNIDFQIDPNGFGNTNEIPPLGSYGNPDYGIFSFTPPYYNPWGTYNEGCLRNEELNSTWMVVNVLTGGSLAFTFGGLGTQTGFYDWAMYPYDASACGAVASNALAPVRCNWNGVSFGGTGLATTPPAGGSEQFRATLERRGQYTMAHLLQQLEFCDHYGTPAVRWHCRGELFSVARGALILRGQGHRPGCGFGVGHGERVEQFALRCGTLRRYGDLGKSGCGRRGGELTDADPLRHYGPCAAAGLELLSAADRGLGRELQVLAGGPGAIDPGRIAMLSEPEQWSVHGIERS
ncbi:MAG: hypothetical protein IPF78_13130 [Flavobacteriales bacterium]|nr:hypothetical protein [Flavobacteriales bacterium]